MSEMQDQPVGLDATGSAATLRGTSALRRFERRSTASLVSETLRDSIIRGELPPGTPLREHALAETLDVSRNTVREALRLLSHEGLVDYHVHRGVAVRKLSAADVRDLFLTREALEVMAVRYSVRLRARHSRRSSGSSPKPSGPRRRRTGKRSRRSTSSSTSRSSS